jgi:hypothetical protein
MKRPLLIAAALGAALALAGCTASPVTSDGSSSTAPTPDPSGNEFADLSVYYPVALGNTWVYSIDYGPDADTYTDTEVMTKVAPEGDGARATIERTFHNDADGTDTSGDIVSIVDYVFAADGSITVPFQSIPSAGDATITVRSGTMTWPNVAEFEAGTPKTGTIEATVQIPPGQPIDETVAFTITGGGTEDVTVPAGSYSARKLLQNLLISVPSFGLSNLGVDAVTWLVEDVGPVRSEVPDALGLGGPTIVQVLVSFTPGG